MKAFEIGMYKTCDECEKLSDDGMFKKGVFICIDCLEKNEQQ